MKENGKLTEKIVKGIIIAGGTLIGMAVSAFIKTKDETTEVEAVDANFEEVPTEETEVTEEVTEG